MKIRFNLKTLKSSRSNKLIFSNRLESSIRSCVLSLGSGKSKLNGSDLLYVRDKVEIAVIAIIEWIRYEQDLSYNENFQINGGLQCFRIST